MKKDQMIINIYEKFSEDEIKRILTRNAELISKHRFGGFKDNCKYILACMAGLFGAATLFLIVGQILSGDIVNPFELLMVGAGMYGLCIARNEENFVSYLEEE